MFDWRIYYGDGSSYYGDVELAPGRNVQIIVQSSREHGWIARTGDFYVYRPGMWFAVDQFGLYDYLLEPGWKKVLFGRMLTNDEYNAIWKMVMSDPNLPKKTGFDKGERRPKWVQQ